MSCCGSSGFQVGTGGSSMPWISKLPVEKKDYSVDWTKWLGLDTIVSVAWTVPTGITEDASSFTTTEATIWLEGGTAGESYTIGCVITTAGGRIAEQPFQVRVFAV